MAATSPSYRIELTDEPPSQERDMLAVPLLVYNEVLLGPSCIRPVAVLIRSQENARLLGGLWGRTSFRWLFIELLFIPEALRGQGIGTQLLKIVEDEAVARECLLLLRAAGIRGLRNDSRLPTREHPVILVQAFSHVGPLPTRALTVVFHFLCRTIVRTGALLSLRHKFTVI